ncbi:MAG: accessory factor UbiK family protein [Nevskiaceae bacterium]|jgi:BMFP domain-containing protein YqiC|nr:accessory factor UbiK family protein [Nevskiaceae bacterium]
MEQSRVEDWVRRLLEGLPPSLAAVRDDLKAHAERVMRSGVQKLDLVSREEFDAQARVLERSREMIAALEARVAELEARAGK